MAISRMTTRNQDPVRAFLKRLDDIERIDPARTRHAHYPNIRGILHPADAREVRPGI
jgi:hypothetical protein